MYLADHRAYVDVTTTQACGRVYMCGKSCRVGLEFARSCHITHSTADGAGDSLSPRKTKEEELEYSRDRRGAAK